MTTRRARAGEPAGGRKGAGGVGKKKKVRVAFRKAFPYEIFKAVVYGPETFKAAPQPNWVPEEADERDWW